MSDTNRKLHLLLTRQEAWGNDISTEQQRKLDAILAAWDAETDHSDRQGPFDGGLDYEESERQILSSSAPMSSILPPAP